MIRIGHRHRGPIVSSGEQLSVTHRQDKPGVPACPQLKEAGCGYYVEIFDSNQSKSPIFHLVDNHGAEEGVLRPGQFAPAPPRHHGRSVSQRLEVSLKWGDFVNVISSYPEMVISPFFFPEKKVTMSRPEWDHLEPMVGG